MDTKRAVTRRQFLSGATKLGAAAIVAPNIITSGALAAQGRRGANDKVQVAYIAIGRRASQLRSLPQDTKVVALADVNPKRLEEWQGKYYKDAKLYPDYRELLASDEVDAVVIASPDHWHGLHTVHACQAGKDVYIEKPLSLTVHEGRAMVDAARKHERIVQTGSQQRSLSTCQTGTRMVREGAFGKISVVHGANYPSPWECDLPEEPVPDGLNWDMWCGQTQPRAYHTDLYLPRAEGRTYPDGRPYGWISYTPYSGGEMTGWGAHGLDIILWALGEKGPVEVWPELEGDSGPIIYIGKPLDPEKSKAWVEGKRLTCPVNFKFASGIIVKLDGKGPGGGAIFEGEGASIMIDRGKYAIKKGDAEPEMHTEPGGVDDTALHLKNWIECIRSRERSVADVETGHLAANMCHVGNIARWVGKKLTWNPDTERFAEEEANAFLKRPMREPWVI
ncbi:MAG: Gfo/Idh/MocA family oxidoreductase [Candidatus Hydrogenedentes bacterium]|nr:Gfo/Idh/MocA family oxidoreductase [Candidatus Hydrogenedentota bacterium]